MSTIKTAAWFLTALLGIGALSACDTLSNFEARDTVAMAEDDFSETQGGYITERTPVSSAFPVRGFQSDDD